MWPSRPSWDKALDRTGVETDEVLVVRWREENVELYSLDKGLLGEGIIGPETERFEDVDEGVREKSPVLELETDRDGNGGDRKPGLGGPILLTERLE